MSLISAAAGDVDWGTVPAWLTIVISTAISILTYIAGKKSAQIAQAADVNVWIDRAESALYVQNGSDSPVRNVNVGIVRTIIDGPVPRSKSGGVNQVEHFEIDVIAPKKRYVREFLPYPSLGTMTEPIVVMTFVDKNRKKWIRDKDGALSRMPSVFRRRMKKFAGRLNPFKKKVYSRTFGISPGEGFDFDEYAWPPFRESMKPAVDMVDEPMDHIVARFDTPDQGLKQGIDLSPDGMALEVGSFVEHARSDLPVIELGYDYEGHLIEVYVLNSQSQFADIPPRNLHPQWQIPKDQGSARVALLVFDDRQRKFQVDGMGVLPLRGVMGHGFVGGAYYTSGLNLRGIVFNDIDKLFHPAFLAEMGVDRN
jgi:hypothetical protein